MDGFKKFPGGRNDTLSACQQALFYRWSPASSGCWPSRGRRYWQYRKEKEPLFGSNKKPHWEVPIPFFYLYSLGHLRLQGQHHLAFWFINKEKWALESIIPRLALVYHETTSQMLISPHRKVKHLFSDALSTRCSLANITRPKLPILCRSSASPSLWLVFLMLFTIAKAKQSEWNSPICCLWQLSSDKRLSW